MVSVGQPERWLKDSILTVCALQGAKEREALNRREATVAEQPVKFKPKIDPIKLKRVEVPSNSVQGLVYTLVCHRTTGEVVSCSCPGFFYRKTCSHKTAYEGSNKKGAQ